MALFSGQAPRPARPLEYVRGAWTLHGGALLFWLVAWMVSCQPSRATGPGGLPCSSSTRAGGACEAFVGPLPDPADDDATFGGPRALRLLAGRFLVAGRAGEAFDRSVALAERTLAAQLRGPLGRAAPRPVRVYVFDDETRYEAYCHRYEGGRCPAAHGFYVVGERRAVANVAHDPGVLVHELVHALVRDDFPGVPTWFDEGLASLYETPWFDGRGGVHGGPNERDAWLREALDTPLGRLEAGPARLLGMGGRDFRKDHERMHYASARSFCRWLDERGQLWAFYERWREGAAGDVTGFKALAETAGLTPEGAAELWRAWAHEGADRLAAGPRVHVN
ncbi:MAG: hypothetical protein MUF34_17750 [Polyangiaceae bacterium]|nr:hypothetical protein [Polyangiaceae bacterium]